VRCVVLYITLHGTQLAAGCWNGLLAYNLAAHGSLHDTRKKQENWATPARVSHKGTGGPPLRPEVGINTVLYNVNI
jgi:hypothetical protein